MTAFLIKRVLQSVLTIFGVLTATFFLVRLAGDPAALLLPIEATDRDIAEFRRALGLDQPLQIQYLKFLLSAIEGDFEVSLRQRRPFLDGPSLFDQAPRFESPE